MGDTSEAEEVTAFDDNITWDDFHNSPQAEIVLVSKDMMGFRVYAWYMKKKSDFFKELLELPSTTPSDIDPIQLNQTADIVRHFIHCASSAGSEQYAVGLDIVRYKEYFALCDFLQAPEVHQSVLKSIADALGRPNYRGTPDAWDVFSFAARSDNFALAKIAIGGFNRSGVNLQYKISTQPSSHYADIPSQYVYALLRSFLTSNGQWRNGSGAAAQFELV